MIIPTNLITGFLGVGKTTAVIDLLQRKPPGSRWAVLVNEYGEVSIDGALIEGSGPEGVTVREVGGGCVCCASAPYLPVALHFLLLDAKPERLIIETTGLGHPARLLDTLRANYRDRLDLRATLCLVDPADFARPEMKSNPVFLDQMHMADVLVMNKLDTATPELVADFQAWANDLYPPKLLIAGTTHGRIDPAWLDLASGGREPPVASHVLEGSAQQQGAHAPRSPGRAMPDRFARASSPR
jgi:G3E family GTPase